MSKVLKSSVSETMGGSASELLVFVDDRMTTESLLYQ